MKVLPPRWLAIRFGRELDREQVRTFLVSVLADRSLGEVIFEVEQVGGKSEFRVGTASAGRLGRALVNHVAGVHVEEVAPPLASGRVRHVVELSTRNRALDTTGESASSARLLGALVVQPGAVHQVRIGPRVSPEAVPRRLDAIPGETWASRAVGAVLTGRRPVDAEKRKALAEKRSLAGSRASVSLLVGPGSSTTAYEAAIRALQAPGLRARVRPSTRFSRTLALNVEELLVLLGWPYGEGSYPGVDRSGATILPAQAPAGEADRVLGRGSNGESIGVSVRDSLRHLHVIGPTGVGKSNLLLHLVRQDLAAGRGAVVIDPKGDLVGDILASTARRHHEAMALIDPAHPMRSVGFNPLGDSELEVDGVLHVLKDLYAGSWGPRTEDVVHSSLLTLSGTQWATLALIPQLLTDAPFRYRVLSAGRLPHHLRNFWAWFEALSNAERAQVTAPVLNKVRPFVMRSALRSMLGQVSPSFSPVEVFTRGRVLLVALRKGEIGVEAAQLIGSLLVAHLWQLAQRRSAIPPGRRQPVMLYLDEFQDYLRLPANFGDLMAQARGLGVGMNLAHQHLGQLRPDVKMAMQANAQNRVAFRLGYDDAATIARGSDQLDARDFTQLAAFAAYANVLAGGGPSGWASMSTCPPPRGVANPQDVREFLLQRDGVARSSVDIALEELSVRPNRGAEDFGRRERESP